MDASKISELTDDQLVSLYRNPSINSEIKKLVLNELEHRDNASTINESNHIGLAKKEKRIITLLAPILIAALPLLMICHHYILKDWTKQKYKDFWNYLTIGIAIYSVLLLAVLLVLNR